MAWPAKALGAWAAHGVTLELTGEANDYVGKGLSGGKLIVRPQEKIGFVPEKSIIVGNTVLMVPSPANAISAAWRANALRCAIPGRLRLSKGSATTAAST